MGRMTQKSMGQVAITKPAVLPAKKSPSPPMFAVQSRRMMVA